MLETWWFNMANKTQLVILYVWTDDTLHQLFIIFRTYKVLLGSNQSFVYSWDTSLCIKGEFSVSTGILVICLFVCLHIWNHYHFYQLLTVLSATMMLETWWYSMANGTQFVILYVWTDDILHQLFNIFWTYKVLQRSNQSFVYSFKISCEISVNTGIFVICLFVCLHIWNRCYFYQLSIALSADNMSCCKWSDTVYFVIIVSGDM